MELTNESVKVYNFQAEDLHTYHVSELGILVYNADYIKATPKDITEMTRKQLKENTPNGRDFQEHNGRIFSKDENDNPLDVNGNIVFPKDPTGHIPYKY